MTDNMTAKEFNNLIEEFEINMLEMEMGQRLDALVRLTRQRHLIAKGTYGAAELLVVLAQLSDFYLHATLCRAICNTLYIHDN